MNDGGGPAFPFPSGPEPRVDMYHDRWEGMSLRDWFAGMALQGMLASWPEGVDLKEGTAAVLAYKFSDAMLAEREKAGG